MTITQMLVIAGAFIVAGIAKGAIGMGLPPIALALMSFAVPLEDALALMVVPTMATSIWQAIYGGGFLRLLRRFATMAIASVVALMFVAVAFGRRGGLVCGEGAERPRRPELHQLRQHGDRDLPVRGVPEVQPGGHPDTGEDLRRHPAIGEVSEHRLAAAR